VAGSKKRNSWNSLFKNGTLFPTELKKKPLSYLAETTIITSKGKYKQHNRFLAKHKNEINVFADVGCALKAGAPTTWDAKKVLGKRATVYAIDLKIDLGPKEMIEWTRKGVIPVKHSISEKPLPQKCDAIRFANVSFYMTQSDRRKSLVNIWKSLNEGGYLLGATYEHSPFVLKKTSRSFELIEPKSIKWFKS